MKNSKNFSRMLVILAVAGMTLTCNLPRLPKSHTPSPEVPPTNTTTIFPRPSLEPVAAPQLHRLCMLNRTDGWALSEDRLLRTEDGGATWLNATPPGLASGFGISATLAALNADHAWLLVASEYPVSGMLYRTADGGQTWTVTPVPFSGGDLKFLDERQGWVLADLGAGAGSQAVAIFRTADGGVTWMQVYVNDPTVSGASDTLPLSGIKSGLGVLDANRAWVGGSLPMEGVVYLYASHDGGRTWAQQTVTLPPGYESAQTMVDAPRFFSLQEGVFYAVLYTENPVSLFYLTRDGGQTWTSTTPLTATGLYATASIHNVWVWDGGPQLHVSRDGGLTWESQTADVDLTYKLAALQFVDAQYGWALTADESGHRALYRTTDGGLHWTALIP